MAEPLRRYKIAVTYVVVLGTATTYTGLFAGHDPREAADRARQFVTRYFRPRYIQSVFEVSDIVTTFAVVPPPPPGTNDDSTMVVVGM